MVNTAAVISNVTKALPVSISVTRDAHGVGIFLALKKKKVKNPTPIASLPNNEAVQAY